MIPLAILHDLQQQLLTLTFSHPISHVYNPLDYAYPPMEEYYQRYGLGKREILLLGMNPGPWGMAQTGVPFGDVVMVRDWMKINHPVDKPKNEHLKRPVMGFSCHRREISGSRLWGWAKERFSTPNHFFQRFFVYNYCPLCFMEESGRNHTPDKIRVDERQPLVEYCNQALQKMVDYYQPKYVIGIGGFAEKQAKQCLEAKSIVISKIPHPSPANPVANRGWDKAAEKAFAEIGITFS